LLLLSLPVLARAQELPPDGIKKLDDAYSREQQNLIGRLARAEINPPRPDDEPTIDLCAKYYIYRFTWQEDPRAKPKLQTEAGRMQSLYTDFEKLLETIAKGRPDNKAFAIQLGKKLIAHAREVVIGTDGKPNDKVIARVNVARVLARLAAEPEQEEAADLLVELLKDKDQNPAVQYWTLHGLREALALGLPRLDEKGTRVEPTPMKKEREESVILALLEFVQRKLPISSTTTPDELRGLRALRREALRALAMSRYPAVLDEKKQIKGPTALVLLRVLRKDPSVNPPPGQDEQLEAAVGLARLQSKLYDGYLPDYTAHEIGMFVSEFATRYVNEGGDRGWKVAAARLTEALSTSPFSFRADVDKAVKDADRKKYILEVVTKSVEILGSIERKAGGLNPAAFGDWIGKTLPKSETVYRGVDNAKVNPPAEP
jgi:hypothetical protein